MNPLYSILEILSVYFTSYIVNENFFIYSTGRDGEVIKINNQV